MKYRLTYGDRQSRACIAIAATVNEATQLAGTALALMDLDLITAVETGAILASWLVKQEKHPEFLLPFFELNGLTVTAMTEQEAEQWQRAF